MSASNERRFAIWSALGLFVFSVLIYRQALGFDFSFFDDHRLLLDQLQLFGKRPLADNLAAIVMQAFPREEPLVVRDLSWLMDSRLFGYGNPFGYHFSNVVIHGLTVCCVFVFLYLRGEGIVPAAVTALLFATLAVNVEPVAWIMGRKDLLAGLFLYLMLIAELRFQRASRPVGAYCWYGLSVLFVALACLSKISAVTYPAVLLLLKLTDSGGSRRPVKSILQVLPHFAMALGLYVWYQGILTEYGVFARAASFEPGDYLKILFVIDPIVLGHYLKLLLFPADLSALYTWPGLAASLSALDWLLAIGVVAGFVFLVGLMIVKARGLLFFLLGFGLLMMPYMNLFNFGWWYANRYVYASGPFLIALLVMVCWQQRSRLSGKVLAGLLLVVGAWNLVVQQQYLPVWHDGESLWTYEAALPGSTLKIHNNLPAYYLSKVFRSPPEQRGHWLDKADQSVARILERFLPASGGTGTLVMDEPLKGLNRTYYYQGAVRMHSGQSLEKQLESFLRAAELSPNSGDINQALGVVYFELAINAGEQLEKESLARQSLNYHARFYSTALNSLENNAGRLAVYQRFRDRFPFLPEALVSSKLSVAAASD